MNYQIEFTSSASKQLKKLPDDIQQKIKIQVEELAKEPRPDEVVKLKNYEYTYRVRVGNYRVLYEIQDELLIVKVIRIGHRQDVYRQE